MNVEVADKIEKLKRMVICHADLQSSLSAITFLNEEADEEGTYDYVELRRLKCYETAFVIAYGRAFTKSKGSKYQQLSFRQIGLQLSRKEKAIHEKIVKARSMKFAHSDLAAVHTRIDLQVMEINGEDFPIHHIQWDEGLEFVSGFEPFEIMDLISKILKHLYEATRALAAELRDHLPIYMRPV